MNQLLNLFARRRQEPSGCSPILLIGGAILAFVAATVLLWTNEGRVDFGRIGAESVPLDASTTDPTREGAFVAASGVLVGDAPVGDENFLRPGDWLAVERLVEMYAWEQKTQNSGDPDEYTPDDYEYRTIWTDDPADSSTFATPEGHTNPPMTVSGGAFRPETGNLDAYTVDLRSLDLPDADPLVLDRERVILDKDRTISGEYIFVGKGSLAEPQVGDLRIHFQVVPSGRTATLFGRVEGERIVPYLHRDRDWLYRAFFSLREDALAEMSEEYRFALWGMRFFGLLLYWASLLLLFSPLTRLLGGVPFLGGLSKGLIAVVTFVIAALLALLVMGIAWFFHNPLALLILLIFAGMVFAVARILGKRIRTADAYQAG